MRNIHGMLDVTSRATRLLEAVFDERMLRPEFSTVNVASRMPIMTYG